MGPPPECATADSGTAVEQALAALEPALRRAARRLTRDADLLDDLIQEAESACGSWTRRGSTSQSQLIWRTCAGR